MAISPADMLFITPISASASRHFALILAATIYSESSIEASYRAPLLRRTLHGSARHARQLSAASAETLFSTAKRR
jgi:hypothetical protein